MKKRICSKNPSARIAVVLMQISNQTMTSRHSLTFVDGVWSIISVGNAPVTISEDVLCEVPVISRVWVIAGMPQHLHLRYDVSLTCIAYNTTRQFNHTAA